MNSAKVPRYVLFGTVILPLGISSQSNQMGNELGLAMEPSKEQCGSPDNLNERIKEAFVPLKNWILYPEAGSVDIKDLDAVEKLDAEFRDPENSKVRNRCCVI